MSVRPSVRSSGSSLSRALNLHLSNLDQSAVSQRSVSSQFVSHHIVGASNTWSCSKYLTLSGGGRKTRSESSIKFAFI